MAQKKKTADRRKTLTRVVSLVLAGLMVLSVVMAAVLTQVFYRKHHANNRIRIRCGYFVMK